MLDEQIFRINNGILGPPADAMVKLAARDDDGEAVRVRELDSKTANVRGADCEAAQVHEYTAVTNEAAIFVRQKATQALR